LCYNLQGYDPEDGSSVFLRNVVTCLQGAINRKTTIWVFTTLTTRNRVHY